MMLTFPKLRQTYDYDCGAKAAQAVLIYYGKDIREEIVMRDAGTSEEYGTPVAGVVRTLEEHGLGCEAREMTTEDLKRFIDHNIPVIIVLQAWAQSPVDWEHDWKDGHYVVAIGYDERHVYFEDPASVLRTYLSYSELDHRWHDVDGRNNHKYRHFGIAVRGQPAGWSEKRAVHMD